MKKFLILICTILIAGLLQAQGSGDEILRAADLYRNSWESFIVLTRIKNFKNDKLEDSSDFEVMIKGSGKSLVRFLNSEQKGQYLLMVDDLMWLYMPNTRRPIRVTPLQRLAGNASNGDVARTNFSRDYQATILGEEQVADQACYKLLLTAKTSSATYPRAEYWVTKAESKPVKAELYLASGKLCKSVSYDEYELVHGKRLLRKMTLIDRLRNNSHTIMEYLEYEPKELPDKYFNKNYLTQLK
ncbi:MAG: outer membrane lipoprotein-sorting protein [candidate division KSB1 bacterium]|nr:outer membrane lipoprotein-sorting protein [candidate division KSB1 bacterium]MDZ7334189.1 outer membrane lipoprotein-sorting protein [candidate division KSB1 bacterium]MDZ7357482.1 outer membrane lipoprotein-sorting protein [candidate division KSB1 bacterium]MDZ7400882.1 outer membrane lipoprotein-sorting protein [candidate division KSB1 bacterium]